MEADCVEMEPLVAAVPALRLVLSLELALASELPELEGLDEEPDTLDALEDAIVSVVGEAVPEEEAAEEEEAEEPVLSKLF